MTKGYGKALVGLAGAAITIGALRKLTKSYRKKKRK
jgi:hypothetical protein